MQLFYNKVSGRLWVYKIQLYLKYEGPSNKEGLCGVSGWEQALYNKPCHFFLAFHHIIKLNDNFWQIE